MRAKNKIISYRTCLYTNKQFLKSELIRLVKTNNKLVLDIEQNKPGRGYWLKLSNQALEDPKLITILSKRCKTNVDDSLIEQLKKLNIEKNS